MLLPILLALATLIAAGQSRAETLTHQGQEIARIEALRLLLANPNAKVLRCNEVELTEKATLRNKKKQK